MADYYNRGQRHDVPQNRQPHARHAAHARTSAPAQRTAASSYDQRQAYDQRRQTRQAPARQEHVNPYLASATAGEQPSRRRQQRRRRSVMPAIIVVLLIAIGAGVGIYLVRNPPIFDVTVNGEIRRVNSGITLEGCVDAGYASPIAGNLLAIDGSVITAGGGDRLAAVVNDNATNDPKTRLHPNDVVTISDGADVTEEYAESTEEIPFGTSWFEPTQGDYYIGSIHQYSAGVPGEQATRTGAISGVTLTEVTREPMDAGLLFYNANVGDDKVIALTFDDGPWPSTTELLDVLKEYGVHATFFTIGNQIAQYPEAIAREEAEGHQIATHTWDHADGSGQGVNLTYMTAEEQINEVDRGIAAIEGALGHEVTHVMRAPGGNFYGSLVDTLQGHITAEIGWNVDTMDWSRPGVDAIVEAVMSVQPGEVILCHDGGGDRSQTIEAMRIAIPQLLEQGYTFLTVDELMNYQPGQATEAVEETTED